MKRPKITYPCKWGYRIIGEDGEALKAAVTDILGERKYDLSFSNISRKGKYISLELTTVVETEEVRNRIFGALQAHPAVKVVI